MKKYFLLLLTAFAIVSCNQNTIISYNETIVAAHTTITKSCELVLNEVEKDIAKPEKKQQLEKLLDAEMKKTEATKKTVETLFQLEKDDFRKDALAMIEIYENLLFKFKNKSELLTNKEASMEALAFMEAEVNKFLSADAQLRVQQQRFAENNNTQLQ